MTMVSNYSQILNKPPLHTSLTTFTNGIGDVVYNKAKSTKQQCLNWFLKSLVSLLAKDVATTFHQSEEEAIGKTQQFELIYSQSRYLYTVLPDATRPMPFGQDKPEMSHSTDELIGTTTHHNSHLQQPPMYGTLQYPSVYGGPPYYHPPHINNHTLFPFLHP
jgi:hypothetical protein